VITTVGEQIAGDPGRRRGEPHGSGRVRLNLRPGNYIATCFVVDIEAGMHDAIMGMLPPLHTGGSART